MRLCSFNHNYLYQFTPFCAGSSLDRPSSSPSFKYTSRHHTTRCSPETLSFVAIASVVEVPPCDRSLAMYLCLLSLTSVTDRSLPDIGQLMLFIPTNNGIKRLLFNDVLRSVQFLNSDIRRPVSSTLSPALQALSACLC